MWVDILQLLRYRCECGCFLTVVGGHQPTFTIDAFDYRRIKSNKLKPRFRHTRCFIVERSRQQLRCMPVVRLNRCEEFVLKMVLGHKKICLRVNRDECLPIHDQ